MFDPLFSVDSEIVVITGSSGQLGYQYTRAFLERGAKVVALDLKSREDFKHIESQHPQHFRFLSCDITQIESLRSAYSELRESFGVPTVLLNNAAIDSPPDASLEETGPFESYPDESWDRVMDVNVKGSYLACKIFGGAMAENERGSIINISSIYGVVSPDQSIYEYRRTRGENYYKPVAYCVSKSALLNLTRYLAVYWAKKNVRVNTLVLAGVQKNQDKDFMQAYCSRIPIGRMADEKEYCSAMIFLASKASSYMTGAQLTIDGGWTAI